MQKIPTLFVRDPVTHRATDQVAPGCEWVIAGEGEPTRKWDGQCCMMRGGRLFRRYELKTGRGTPADFEAAGEPDPENGNQPGWVPVGDGPDDQWFREAAAAAGILPDGTYELLGPKVNGNTERLDAHVLRRHGARGTPGNPRDFLSIGTMLNAWSFEGIVWHHPDGRMAKIKRRDFGLAWPMEEGTRDQGSGIRVSADT